MKPVPFRYDLARREQLGRLADGAAAEPNAWSQRELRACCARVAAAAADGEMVFVGRSPESLFDYLGGVLEGTAWADRLTLLNLSTRFTTVAALARESPDALDAVHAQMAALGLSPGDLAAGERPRVFVDLVSRGGTFERLMALLEDGARRAGVDPAAVRRRVRFVGITKRTRNSPNTWRWYQHAPWAAGIPRRALRSVSVDYWFWTHLGDSQPKVARSHPPDAWGSEAALRPPRGEETVEAVRTAYAVRAWARRPAERARFAAALVAQREIREPAVRRLVRALRGG